MLLREAVRNTFVKDQGAYADAVSRGLQRPAVAALPGWEPLERARQRVADAVSDIISRCRGDVVLVGHGTAWTLLINYLLDEPLPQNRPPMAMPDLLILDLTSRTVISRWGDWRTQQNEP